MQVVILIPGINILPLLTTLTLEMKYAQSRFASRNFRTGVAEGFEFSMALHLGHFVLCLINCKITPLSATFSLRKKLERGLFFLYLQFSFPHLMRLISSFHYISCLSSSISEDLRHNCYFYQFTAT